MCANVETFTATQTSPGNKLISRRMCASFRRGRLDVKFPNFQRNPTHFRVFITQFDSPICEKFPVFWGALRPRSRFGAKLQCVSEMSNPNCFRGYPPTTVLGSYILDKWSDFSTLSSETRIRIRCIFDLFFSRMLWPTHFLQIIESHYPNMLAAATILAKTRERRQIQCFTQCFPVTNKEKTLVLLSSYEMLSQVEWIGFLGLTRVQAYDRIRHVVSRLEEKGMLNDSSSSSKKIFQIVQCGEVTIATHVKDDLGILKARLMREQHARRKHDIQMRLALVRLNKKIHNMEQQLCERHVGDNDESDDDQDSEENVITDSFFKELFEYGTRPGQARRYSSRFLQVSDVLYLTSRKAYQILRQLLPFPSPGCLKSHFSETLATIKYMLTDSELVPEHISNVLPKCSANNIPRNFYISISSPIQIWILQRFCLHVYSSWRLPPPHSSALNE